MINKVFGIGLSHTATTSLNAALNILGVKSIHWPVDKTTYQELSCGHYDLTILKEYQAVTDITVSPFYQALDRNYPGSKFILTTRNKESWIKSMAIINKIWKEFAHKNSLQRFSLALWKDLLYYKSPGALRTAWKRTITAKAVEFYRIAQYGGIAFEDEEVLSNVYDKHQEDVLNYFKGRDNDLLVLNVCNGEGWEKLCPFLGRPIPAEKFPHKKDLRHQKRKEKELLAQGV